jgi:hypothetical protein
MNDSARLPMRAVLNAIISSEMMCQLHKANASTSSASVLYICYIIPFFVTALFL